jgi:chromosome segregation protein
MAEIASIEAETLTAEEAVQDAADDAKTRSDDAAGIVLAAGQLKTEIETLTKLLRPSGDSGLPPVLDRVKVEPGYEVALAAALGDDLEAPASAQAPIHWRLNPEPGPDGPLPSGIDSLAAHVTAPPELARRLKQIGVVARRDG